MTNGEKYKTAKERAEAFRIYCMDTNCTSCSVKDKQRSCAFEWLDLPATEEKPMPCPFCGEYCWVADYQSRKVIRCECGYESQRRNTRYEAIAEHNRICRAVAAQNESEVAR